MREISLINTGSDVYETSYGKLFSGSGVVNGIGIGTIQIDQNGTDVDFKFIPVQIILHHIKSMRI